MPGGADPEKFAERRNFSSHANAADLAEVASDVIDEAVFDDIHVLVGVIEEFTHRNGRGALLAQNFEITDILRAKRIFHEEWMILLDFFANIDRVDGIEAFVHVVEQFDFFAEIFAHELEK